MSKPITLKMIAAHDLPRTYVPGTDAWTRPFVPT